MVRKKVFQVLLSVLVISLILCTYVSAITGSIGNARMILRVDVGDRIERSVLVKNVNDVAIDINISASGDLENYTEVIDRGFRLEAGQEKDARFTIDVKKNGTFETKINVMFSPVEGKNGVGLSSTIVVISNGEGEDEGSDVNTVVNVNNLINLGGKIAENKRLLLFALPTILILVILIVMLVILYKRKNKPKKKVKKGE